MLRDLFDQVIKNSSRLLPPPVALSRRPRTDCTGTATNEPHSGAGCVDEAEALIVASKVEFWAKRRIDLAFLIQACPAASRMSSQNTPFISLDQDFRSS